jgi:hypothetical protein
MFPAGAPGGALLILRCCIAVAMAGIAFPAGWEHTAFLVLLSLLCFGLLTPIVCITATLLALLDLPHLLAENVAQVIIVLLCTSSFAFLGPGAFSIDARLFARRIVLSDRASQSEIEKE